MLQSAVQVLQNAVQKLQVAAGAAGHMYVLLGVDCCIERRCRVVCCLQELSK